MTIQSSYLKRSQRVTIIPLDTNSTWTYDAPLWTLTEVSEPIPAWREDYVTVPGRAGVLDLSRALTGDVVRDARTVRIGLFAECGDHAEAASEEWVFRSRFDGKRCRVQTPDALEIYGAYAFYEGNCRIVEASTPFNYLYVTLEFTCDPYLYIGEGATTLTHTTPVTITGGEGNVGSTAATATAQKRVRLSMWWGASSATGTRETPACSTVGLWSASSENRFDLSAHTVADQAAKSTATTTWQAGTAVHRSGQRIYTDELGETWRQRILITALNTTDARSTTTGAIPAFPLLGVNAMRVQVYMSGTVTALGTAHDGVPVGIRLDYGTARGALNVTADTPATSMTTQSASFTPTATTYNAQKIIDVEVADASALNMLMLTINWIHTGTDGLQFAIQICDSTLAMWRTAQNRACLFALPSTLQATNGTGSDYAWTDRAVIDGFTTTLEKRTQPGWTPYRAELTGSTATLTRATRTWPSWTGSTNHVQAHPAMSDGRAVAGNLAFAIEVYTLSNASLSIGTMASDVYLTNPDCPVYLSTSAGSAFLPASATKQVTPLTARGTATVSYAIVGDDNGETNQLTWTRGAL